jgi:biopolymer transport protein ExbD
MGAPTRSPGGDSDLIATINVTPFVDVVLVLLVIFMVTAPIVLKDAFQVRLPKTANADPRVAQTLGIAITREGQVLLHGKPVDETALRKAAEAALAANAEASAILAADVDARHGDIVRVIDWLKGAGLERFAFQIER